MCECVLDGGNVLFQRRAERDTLFGRKPGAGGGHLAWDDGAVGEDGDEVVGLLVGKGGGGRVAGSGGGGGGGGGDSGIVGVGEGVADGGRGSGEKVDAEAGGFAGDAGLLGVDDEFGPLRRGARGYSRQ